MKTAGIIAVITAFFGKAWQIIKAVSKLKTVKKEVMEAYTESKEAYECAMLTVKKIQSFFDLESDGGKKLTMNEITQATELIKKLSKEIKEATTETMEAKTEIKKVIDSIKKKK